MAIFRTDPLSGLKIEKSTENLVRWNLIAAFATLAVGGLLGLLVVLTRWPSVHLLPLDYYYRFLTLHGIDALLAWIIFFEIALVHFTSAAILGVRSYAPWLGWLAFALMLAGGAVINVIVLMGGADIMFTSYVPLKGSPMYYLGVILFAVGALLGFIVFFINIAMAKRDGGFKRTLPLGSFGMLAASIIAVLTLAHGAAIMVPTWLWSMDILGSIDPAAYRLVFWGLGHPSQQINVSAMVAVWYMTSAFVVGGKPVNEKLSRTAFVLYILFINVASEHHLLVDPVLSTWHKIVNTSYMMHLAVLASMIHAFAIPASIEVALRKQGHTRGLFEWLKKAPWGNPAFSGTAISILLFGFLGGTTGVIFGTEQFNIIRHNTIAITGHFHSTVVAGTTLAFMGFTYLLIPFIFRREIIWKGFATIQPWIYGVGVALLSIGMMSAGSFGVPRRHYDITFSGAPFSFTFDPSIDLFLSMMGVGGLLAVAGGVLYICLAFGSIIWGKKIEQ
ncbi:MAG TPA: cytochrome C oxidase subunit I [Deltaproteobacteria bacterium]|nr:MAG: cytochrome C oxidase subunit I [Deltaproteobacteria bacterium GWA2_55_82]OGQ62168.1 MAG: cytochrome C oxidase subunit I [Deltaproteobacteria bacterium RIFCSPLOWO2_02_FULL_55_12]OIJ73362.1 MAG: cytochrome C oxidase subunit I [Deltaproteobacteria bacterium GWC2_55_46]HBG45362.1 cytochrome C oxidase subunit I [Deltaproteobacteria bacterium]HCY10193.1 cytochrome C oxidase subunit I [Deltaproteobacteria bacterium]